MKKLLIMGFIAALVFNSCLGMKTHVKLKKNGSGTINVEYQVSQQFLAMAAASSENPADGLEFAIPLGRSDFEKSLQGVKGIKLTSYKTSDDETNRNYFISISFDNIEALANYLDAQGMMCVYENDDGKNKLLMFFAGSDEAVDDQMRQMAPILFEGYSMDFSIDLPGAFLVRYLDMDGEELNKTPVGAATVKKNSFSFATPMSDLITAGQPVVVELIW
jgi:hypothetical protein